MKIITQTNRIKFSKIISLYNRNNLLKVSASNPFKTNLKVDIFLPKDGNVELKLYDLFGKIVAIKSIRLNKGNSQVVLDNVNLLAAGVYILRTSSGNIAVQNKFFKTD